MANLVILFTGNVGSTPLVQLAGRHPKICVPIAEDFDQHNFSKFPIEVPLLEALAETIDCTFQRQMTPYLETRKRRWDELPSQSEVPHMVFKWRVGSYADSEQGGQAVAEVFRRHNARPALLARRSVVEQAIKVHMTESHYGSRHPQFKAASLNDEEYEARLRAQESVSLHIDKEGLATCRKLAQSFFLRTKATLRGGRSHFGKRPELIFAEDFLRPEIDYGAASAILSHLLDDEITLGPDMSPKVRRAGLTLANCANLDALATDPHLRKIEHRYQELLAQVPPVIGRAPRVPLLQRLRARLSPPPLALGAANQD